MREWYKLVPYVDSLAVSTKLPVGLPLAWATILQYICIEDCHPRHRGDFEDSLMVLGATDTFRSPAIGLHLVEVIPTVVASSCVHLSIDLESNSITLYSREEDGYGISKVLSHIHILVPSVQVLHVGMQQYMDVKGTNLSFVDEDLTALLQELSSLPRLHTLVDCVVDYPHSFNLQRRRRFAKGDAELLAAASSSLTTIFINFDDSTFNRIPSS